MISTEAEKRDRSFKTTPIFVLGLQRSGTTWVANILCQHASCIGIQSDDHGGIHESVFFSHFSRSYGDLCDEDNYRRFARDFAQSDYFLLSDLSPSWFDQLPARDYGTIFHDLMERVALRRGATHWVEKSPHHSLYCHELARLYPHAKFVCVSRAPNALIASLLNAPWRSDTRYPLRAIAILRSCMTYALFTKHLDLFARHNPNAIRLRYEDLVTRSDEELTKLCTFLGLPYQPDLLDVPFARNSSFRSTRDRSQSTSALDRVLTRVFISIFQAMPHRLLYLANELKISVRPEPWPNWVWRRSPLVDQPPVVRA